MPENYYNNIDVIQKILRQKDNNSAYSSITLIPIPGHNLYDEINKKRLNSNKIFKEELEVLFLL